MSTIDILLTTSPFCRLFEESKQQCKGCLWLEESSCEIPLTHVEEVEGILKCLDYLL